MIELLEKANIPKSDRQKAVAGLHLVSQYTNHILAGDVPTSTSLIRELNRRALWFLAGTHDSKNSLGNYRSTSAVLTNAFRQPPNHHELIPAMKRLCTVMDQKLVNLRSGLYHMRGNIEFAAQTHYELAINHPFPDANGRVCRSMVDIIFRLGGLKRILIGPAHKSDYIGSLDKVSRTGEIGYFTIFLLRRLQERYSSTIKTEEPYAMVIDEILKETQMKLVVKNQKHGGSFEVY